MVRNRASAKKAGADLEIGQEEYWRKHWQAASARFITRGRNQGQLDKGDLLHVELDHATFLAPNTPPQLTVECKNERELKLGTWWGEAQRERDNNTKAIAAIVVHKRHGFDAKKQPGKQWVTLTVEDLFALIRGNRDHIEE